MKEAKGKKSNPPVRSGPAPDDNIKAVKESAKEKPKIFKIVRFSDSSRPSEMGRRDFLQKATKVAGLSGVAALSGLLSSCSNVSVNKPECTCDLQTGNASEACSCHAHTARCTCDTVAPCACDTVCTCDLDNGKRVIRGSRYTNGICTCNTVCTCNRVSVCTCQVYCTCQSTCTCQITGHYWYPN
jgi:hypothetical protein